VVRKRLSVGVSTWRINEFLVVGCGLLLFGVKRTEVTALGLFKRAKSPVSRQSPNSRSVLVGGVPQGPVHGPPDHDPGWEYLYLATQLAKGIHGLDARFNKYMSGQVTPTGVSVSDPVRDAKSRCDEAAEIVDQVNKYFDPKLLESAFGPLGVAGDEATIRFVADGIAGVFESCLKWGETIRGTAVPIQWQSLYASLADMVTLPMQEIQEFSKDFLSAVEESVGAVRAGKSTGQVLNFTLKITIDPAVTKRFEAALGALEKTL